MVPRNLIIKVFLPERLPDEILFSIVARYVDDRPWVSLYSVLRVSYGYETSASFLGNRLDYLSLSTEGCWGMTASEIAEEFTCYPYFAALVRPQKREDLLRAMTESGTDLKGRSQARLMTVGAHGVRFCEQCFSDDRRTGTPLYWRRVHQLPGVILCPWHAEFLWEISNFKKYRQGFFSPNRRWEFSPQRIKLRLNELQRHCCMEVSRISLFLLNEKITVFPETVRSHLESALAGVSPYFRGWRGSTCVARLFEMCFGRAYLMLNGLVTKEKTIEDTTIRFVFGRGDVCSPLRLVLCAVLIKEMESNREIVAERNFSDLYGIPSSRVRPYVDRDRPIKRLNCPNVKAKHGPNHPLDSVSRIRGRIAASCSCGMTFRYPDSPDAETADMRVGRWSTDHVSAILRMNSLGKSQRVIGASLGMSSGSVGQILVRNGVISKQKRRKK
jgi:hypothetical protein